VQYFCITASIYGMARDHLDERSALIMALLIDRTLPRFSDPGDGSDSTAEM
jgi:hypothetical protein